VDRRQLEGELVGLAHLDDLLEQTAPGVDRPAGEQSRPSQLQDVGVGRSILAPLGMWDRLLDVGVHLLAGRPPRQRSHPGSQAQPDAERTTHIGGAGCVNRLARRPMGAGILAAVNGQGRRGDQTPHALVIGDGRGIDRGLQPSVHLPG
jgi:hypothetical protein